MQLRTSLQTCSLALMLLECVTTAGAFTIRNVGATRNIQNKNDLHKPSTQLMASDSSLISSESSKLSDNQGVEFTEGCTIQTSKEIKAYQVPKKGFGSFDEDKNFVPVDGIEDVKSVPRIDKCLVIPTGMRAKVSKVYNIDEYDASQPIIAKFLGGDGLGGDFEPPLTFLMHFETYEIEVVS